MDSGALCGEYRHLQTGQYERAWHPSPRFRCEDDSQAEATGLRKRGATC